MRLSDDSLAR